MDYPKRISRTAQTNNETYITAYTESSNYYKHFEHIVHEYFRDQRIVRTNIKDGRTEWFYANLKDVISIIKKAKVYLNQVHNDYKNGPHWNPEENTEQKPVQENAKEEFSSDQETFNNHSSIDSNTDDSFVCEEHEQVEE